MENPYYEYFKDVKGLGNNKYYTGIGHIYKSRGGIQRGYGFFIPGCPTGKKRGLGLGTILKSIFSTVTPLIKKVAPHILKAVGTTATDTIANIAKDSIQGSNFKESTIKHGKTALNQLKTQLPKAFTGVIEQYKNDPVDENETSYDIEYPEDGPLPPPPKKRKYTRRQPHKSHKKKLKKRYPGLKYFE